MQYCGVLLKCLGLVQFWLKCDSNNVYCMAMYVHFYVCLEHNSVMFTGTKCFSKQKLWRNLILCMFHAID